MIFNISIPNYAKDSDLIDLGCDPGICILKARHKILMQVVQGSLFEKPYALMFSAPRHRAVKIIPIGVTSLLWFGGTRSRKCFRKDKKHSSA